ncbi:MAG: hypothetical protein ABI882_05920, partial [Acidobacteriota bacterium]
MAMSQTAAAQPEIKTPSLPTYLPVVLPIVGAAIMVALRRKLGPGSLPDDGGLIVMGLFCYIIAAAALGTNLWAPNQFLQ